MDRCPHDVWRDRSAISSSMRDGGRSRELSRLPGEIYRVRRAERERQSPMIGGPEINTGTGVRGQATGTPGGVIRSRSASTFCERIPRTSDVPKTEDVRYV